MQNSLEGFCDSLPSSIYEESSHVKVFSHIINYLTWREGDSVMFELALKWNTMLRNNVKRRKIFRNAKKHYRCRCISQNRIRLFL